MKFYSLNKKAPDVGFREATIGGQAPDGGLYFPEKIPTLPVQFIRDLDQLPAAEIGFEVIRPYVGNEIAEQDLFQIVRETVEFDIPLVAIREGVYSLELFHGPTLAFKDVGARFMSRCLGYFARELDGKITVLVATSGDTGGAVASGFYQVPGVEVVTLFPSGKVSRVQEKQLTTLGKNIHTLEVNGNFDDCQRLVKTAFRDQDLQQKMFLTSANSINVARWLPQQFYYFFAWKQWSDKTHPPVFSVPSGNFGNICAGLLAYQSGLPAKKFLAACNRNNVVTRFLETGRYEPVKATPTLSNAMDVGDPSNFIRILELFHHRLGDLKRVLESFSFTDEQTLETIREVYQEYDYLLDPHGAVGYAALEKYLQNHPGDKGIVLETAHPVKFPESIEKVTGKPVPVPSNIAGILEKPGHSVKMGTEYEELKQFLHRLI